MFSLSRGLQGSSTTSPLVQHNRWVESERVETRRGSRCWRVPYHLRSSSSVSHKGRSRCEIKLWLQWFEVQAWACCAALVSEGRLRGWIDCRSYTDATAFASLHKHLIMWRVKLSNSQQCDPKQEEINVVQLCKSRTCLKTESETILFHFISCWGGQC